MTPRRTLIVLLVLAAIAVNLAIRFSPRHSLFSESLAIGSVLGQVGLLGIWFVMGRGSLLVRSLVTIGLLFVLCQVIPPRGQEDVTEIYRYLISHGGYVVAMTLVEMGGIEIWRRWTSGHVSERSTQQFSIADLFGWTTTAIALVMVVKWLGLEWELWQRPAVIGAVFLLVPLFAPVVFSRLVPAWTVLLPLTLAVPQALLMVPLGIGPGASEVGIACGVQAAWISVAGLCFLWTRPVADKDLVDIYPREK